MATAYEFLGIQCANDGDKLIRITGSESDTVVCPTCFAIGGYEDVVKQGGGLAKGVFVGEDAKDLIEHLRRRREVGF